MAPNEEAEDRRGPSTGPRRGGWRLPHPTSGHKSSPTKDTDSIKQAQEHISDITKAKQPQPTLTGSVIGQVATVNETSVQVNQQPVAVSTLRLESHTAHEGRTAVATVRLQGPEAVGFAEVGDWIEVTGKKKSVFLLGAKAINHTTNATFTKPSHMLQIIIFTMVVAVMASMFITFAVTMHKRFNDYVEEQHEQAIEQCLAQGHPRSFCDSIPGP